MNTRTILLALCLTEKLSIDRLKTHSDANKNRVKLRRKKVRRRSIPILGMHKAEEIRLQPVCIYHQLNNYQSRNIEPESHYMATGFFYLFS